MSHEGTGQLSTMWSTVEESLMITLGMHSPPLILSRIIRGNEIMSLLPAGSTVRASTCLDQPVANRGTLDVGDI